MRFPKQRVGIAGICKVCVVSYSSVIAPAEGTLGGQHKPFSPDPGLFFCRKKKPGKTTRPWGIPAPLLYQEEGN